MKRNFHCLALLAAVTILTGCETAKYTMDQTFGDQREFGAFQTKQQEHPDLLIAKTDDWVKDHLW